jgi:hypothetical protein
MLKYLAVLLFAVSASAQSATTTYNGSNIVTVVTDTAANTYTVTTPLSVSVGSPVLVFNQAPVVVPPPPPAPTAPVIPSTAVVVNLLPQTWKACVHDAGTPGTATCSGSFPVTDAVTSASSRSFSMTYTGAGGVRWADSFANDTAATNFVLDTTVTSPDWTHTANLELDTNQTKANGHTAILGTQCSSYGHSWQVTLMNSSGSWSWYNTNLSCDPTKWTPNVLHHIRIFGTIDASEVATYIGVEFDGSYGAFSGATGMTGRALGWSVGSNLTNFQIDGLGTSGSATIYADKLTETRW